MPRGLRIEYEGALYHVMNRGDRRENIFFGDEDRLLFLKTMEEAGGKSRWQVSAYCLMSNHFHLVIETPMPTLVAGMAWMVFHLGSVCDPMHPNLARTTLIGGEKKLEPYAWSSCAESLKTTKKCPEWLKTVRLRDAECTQTRKRSDSDAQRGCLSATRWELEIPCECAFPKCVNMNDRPFVDPLSE
jgi:hypothetical protein